MVLETILGKELTRHFTFQIGVRKMKTEGRDANLVWCGYVEALSLSLVRAIVTMDGTGH